MKWNESNQRISVTTEEINLSAFFSMLPPEECERRLPPRGEAEDLSALGLAPVELSSCLSGSAFSYFVRGRADGLREAKEGAPCEVTLVYRSLTPKSPGESAVKYARGEAFLTAHLTEEETVLLTILFYNRESGESHLHREVVKKPALALFFDRALGALETNCRPALDRAAERIPKLMRLKFPYPEARLGQETFMQDVFRALSRGERLYASAPTGIGKTVSTLYPALKVLSKGRLERIFYLTAKETAAAAVAAIAERMGRDGAFLSMVLTAKEKLCEKSLACRQETFCGNARSGKRMDDALAALYQKRLPLADHRKLGEVAREFRVCPYELSLRYAELCELVVCDYNYLFHPSSRLHRFFSTKGDYAFLIDEAHNLPSRIREMYSLSLEETEVASLRAELPCDDPLIKPLSDFSDYLATFPEEEVTEDALSPALCERVSLLLEQAEGRITKSKVAISPKSKRQVKQFCYKLKTILNIFAVFDGRFRLRMGRSPSPFFRTVCLDPAGVADASLSLGHGAVLFSATLSPIDYYRDLLGGEEGAETLLLPSPFDRENLALFVMDKISVRYEKREETLADVSRAVEALTGAKPGNYMIFCPSFQYLERLSSVYRPKEGERVLKQSPHTSLAARRDFLAAFEDTSSPLTAFCVMGGIYGESVDLIGGKLLGVAVIGTGIAPPDRESEELAAYYQEKKEAGREYAYLYPAFNRVLQAVGRVIRSESDIGAALLIDERYAAPVYRENFPPHWHGLKYVGNLPTLKTVLRRFWEEH